MGEIINSKIRKEDKMTGDGERRVGEGRGYLFMNISKSVCVCVGMCVEKR